MCIPTSDNLTLADVFEGPEPQRPACQRWDHTYGDKRQLSITRKGPYSALHRNERVLNFASETRSLDDDESIEMLITPSLVTSRSSNNLTDLMSSQGILESTSLASISTDVLTVPDSPKSVSKCQGLTRIKEKDIETGRFDRVDNATYYRKRASNRGL